MRYPAFLAALASTLMVFAASAALISQAPPATSGYFRLHESEDGGLLTMQLATKQFRRDGDDRVLSLAAMVHIADRPFYQLMQQKLDANDLVLFEGVRPPGGGRAEFDLDAGTDEARAASTKKRIRFLAIALNLHKNKHGSFPKDLPELLAKASDRLADVVRSNLNDAWDRPMSYSLEAAPPADAPAPRNPFEIKSLGADGEPDGEGAAADLLFSQQKPLKSSEIPKSTESRGLQQQMASALGLVFQLDEMDHTKPNWRSSDLSVDQIEDRMSRGSGEGGSGGEAEELFKMLDGSSFQAGIVKMVLGIMKLFPSAQTYGKLAMMEIMSRADDIMHIVPPGFAGAMEVIINDRNAVVIADLKQALDTEPGLKSIGIIYGGGHMMELEKSILAMGFKEVGVQWTDAISLDVKASGFTPKEVKQIRETVSSAFDQQIKAAKRKAKKKAKSS